MSRSADHTGNTASSARMPAQRKAGAFVHAALALGLAAACLGVFGFVRYAGRVAGYTVPQAPQADGIVILTGGADRLADAAGLLAAGRAARLLVSGVAPVTTRASMARALGISGTVYARTFGCCVDLDYTAVNTASNAEQAARWAAEHRFRSLIVVTSAYHMPRSLNEFRLAMPELQLVPYPVYRAGLDLGGWYHDREVLRLLLQEYPKYMASELKRIVPGL